DDAKPIGTEREALQRVFAPRLDPRRTVQGYLKAAHPGNLIVAVSLPEDADGFCDGALRLWAPHLERFQQETRRISLCLLNRTIHGAGAVAPPLDAIACVRGLGLGLADALALAQAADVYLGRLDVFGLAAMAAGTPGVYLDPSAADPRLRTRAPTALGPVGARVAEPRGECSWRRAEDSPEASLAALRLLVDEVRRTAEAGRECR